MTKEEILQLEGDKLDEAIVNSDIFEGWPYTSTDERGAVRIRVPRFSEKIGYAWDVLEIIRDSQFSTRYLFMETLEEIMNESVESDGWGVAPKAWLLHVQPKDICRAALIANEEDFS